jgi:NagD protein
MTFEHHDTMKPRLQKIRHVALDMDGTIYKGRTLFEHAAPFLNTLRELDLGYTFLTNNSSRSVADYLAHLHRFGIPATEEQLYTSTQATLEYLQRQWPALRRLFILGTPSMAAEFRAAGYLPVGDGPEENPDAVVVGFDPNLSYARLCRAAWWIRHGKPYFATNPDRVCPTDEPTTLVDCGAICAALREATGVPPAAVMGKPDPGMIHGILRRHGLTPDQLAMVGDRLYTDVLMAHRAGALGILVLTGETTAAEAEKFSPPPDLVVADLEELAARLRAAKMEIVSA